MNEKSSSIRVAILVFPETSASVLYGMYDMFMCAGRDWEWLVNGKPGPQLLMPSVIAASSEPFSAGNGVRITPDASLHAFPHADVVCVPDLLIPPGEPLIGRFPEEIAYLKQVYEGGAIIATACSSAMLLAEAGLLNGNEATTHWAYCDVMARAYPDIKVRRQRALVASGEGQRLVMAGGGTSWIDLTLYLLARLTSVDVAMQVARINLIAWHDIGQLPYSRLARSIQVDDALISRCQAWIAEHYADHSPVRKMTELSGLPERSFKRRFQQATGMSPIEYVHTLRLEEAKQMLEAGNQSIESIASEIGYEDAGFFCRLFRREVGLTPAHYRRRFGAMRQALHTLA